MLRRVISAIVAALVLCAGTGAAAEPVRLLSPSTVTTDAGSTVRLPPSVCMEAETWSELDEYVRGLQDETTRLRAENETFRREASTTPKWVAIGLGSLAAGFAAGWASKRLLE